MLALPLSGPGAPPVKKKRVLLVDGSTVQRDLRAETMRKLGMDVDCAADISEARLWWRADLYHLVLFSVENELGHRDKFCEDIRGATPPQQLAFLVGKPGYLADAPNADEEVSIHANGNGATPEESLPPIHASGETHLRWGIMEASRRISAVRSVAAARTRAMRDRPSPPRDLETRFSRQLASRLHAELEKEEMQ